MRLPVRERRNRLQPLGAYPGEIDYRSPISSVEARDLLNLLYRVDEACTQRNAGARRYGHLAPGHGERLSRCPKSMTSHTFCRHDHGR
jgi:hypothetical protein